MLIPSTPRTVTHPPKDTTHPSHSKDCNAHLSQSDIPSRHAFLSITCDYSFHPPLYNLIPPTKTHSFMMPINQWTIAAIKFNVLLAKIFLKKSRVTHLINSRTFTKSNLPKLFRQSFCTHQESSTTLYN